MKLACLATLVPTGVWIIAATLHVASGEVLPPAPRGALGQVTLRVVDSKGGPVSEARVSAGFYNPSLPGQVAEGETDTNGLFTASGIAVVDMRYTVMKDGYYTTEEVYLFAGEGTNRHVANGRWEPWNQTKEVVIKERRRPAPMYARRVEEPVPVKDTEVLFDLEAGDWVTPYGKGAIGDIGFTYRSAIRDPWNGSQELTVSGASSSDGFYVEKKDMGSELVSAYEARATGYEPRMAFAFETSSQGDLRVERLEEAEYVVFRVRTVVDDEGNIISARYGKMYGPLEFGVGQQECVRFTYMLNPVTNDRNLEFDPDQNLFPVDGGNRVYEP